MTGRLERRRARELWAGGTMNLAAVDNWIGKTLFLPLIIKLCQATRQTQYAVSRLFWFVVALDQLRLANTLGERVVAGVFSLVMMLTASLRADMPAVSMMWFRILAIVMLLLDVARSASTGEWKGVEAWLLILFAEYAATIRTIPPTETKRAEPKVTRSRSS
jgi:hypothetical protein